MTNAVNLAQGASNNVTFRNRIINGAMVISQRNGTSSVTINSAAWTYTVDRFCCLGQSADGVYTVQQSSTAPAGFVNSLLVTVTTADSSVGAGQIYTLRQTIEGYNVADLNWGTANAQSATLSFWVRSSVTGTFSGCFNNEGTASYPFTYTISSANTWEQKTVTVTGPTSGTWGSTNSNGIRLTWSLGTGSTYSGTANTWNYSTEYFAASSTTNLISTNGATFYITGVQLEAGTAASPFENRSFGQELVLCQRYFEKTFSLTTAPAHNTGEFISWPNAGSLGCGGNTYVTIQFNTRKRATNATLRLYDPGASHTNSENWWRYWGGCGGGTAVGPNSGIALSATETFISGDLAASTGAANSFNWTAESEL